MRHAPINRPNLSNNWSSLGSCPRCLGPQALRVLTNPKPVVNGASFASVVVFDPPSVQAFPAATYRLCLSSLAFQSRRPDNWRTK